MSSENEYEELIARGARAKQLREDPMIKGFIDGIRETTFDNIRTSPRQNVEEREELYKMLRVIDAFEQQFKKAMNDGKMAQSRLAALRQRIGI